MPGKRSLLFALAILSGLTTAGHTQERGAGAAVGATTATPTSPLRGELRDAAVYGTLVLLAVALDLAGPRLPPPAAERVYFCRLCVIYAYKPEPCVCCGMEMELLASPPAPGM